MKGCFCIVPKKCIRISAPVIAAPHAPFLPQQTAVFLIIGTMSGKRPAVMKGPDHRNVFFFDKRKQKLCLQIKPMQIVQMQDIRLYFFQIPQKTSRGSSRAKSGLSQEKIAAYMSVKISPISDFIGNDSFRRISPAIGHGRLCIMSARRLIQICRNSPDTSLSTYRIDQNNFQHICIHASSLSKHTGIIMMLG